MEKEPAVPKPGDVFIGVIDLFAVLVPGVIAAAFVVKAVGASLKSDILFLSGLLIAGWVLGHVLHGLGSWLDPLLYDRLFKPQDPAPGEPPPSRTAIRSYFHKNDDLYKLAKRMTDVPKPDDRTPGARIPGGMYQWARTWLDSHSPEAANQLDRLEADSKLFRSLAVLLLILTPIIIAVPGLIAFPSEWRLPPYPRVVFLVLAVAGIVFSLWRYCDLRNKMIRRCYLHYIQLIHQAGGGAKSA